MLNKSYSKYIDLIFALGLMPLLLLLVPLDRWIDSRPLFVVVLIIWLYALYFVNRYITLPFLFRGGRYLYTSIAIFLLSLIVNSLVTQFDYMVTIVDDSLQIVAPTRASVSAIRIQSVWFLYLIVTTFSFTVGLLSEVYRQYEARQAFEFEKRRAELALYKAQINPHFLFNTLNTLYGLIVTSSERADAAFSQFSYMMEYMYTDGVKDEVLIISEVEYIKQYIELQRYRLNDTTQIHFEYENDISRPNAKIAPLLLITFVENAIKYGVAAHLQSDIYVKVQFKRGKLYFMARNKIFKKQTDQENKIGIGINNCINRLELLYPGQYTLQIDDSNDIYNVELNLECSDVS
ncbi:MAG: histidine kinase [Rikenellaceae bacterium]